MQTNALPHYDHSVNTTGCCRQFNPEGWDGQTLHFKDKPFVRAKTYSVAHIPVNMGKVFSRVLGHIDQAGACDLDQFITLSRDVSPFTAEHLFAVTKPVPDEEMTTITGDFVTRVFEGPYRNVPGWHDDMEAAAHAKGRDAKSVWFFYTTCPKCAKAYGKNYVVAVAELT